MNRNWIHKMMKKIGLPLFCGALLLSCVSCGNIKKVEKTTKKVEVSEESWQKEPVVVSEITHPLDTQEEYGLVLPQVEDIGKEFVFLAYMDHYLTYRSDESAELSDTEICGGYDILQWAELLDQDLNLKIYYRLADDEDSDYLEELEAYFLICEVTGKNSHGQTRRHFIQMCMTNRGFTRLFENAESEEGELSDYDAAEIEEYLSENYTYAGETEGKIQSERAEQFYPEIAMTEERQAEIDTIQRAVQKEYGLDKNEKAAVYLPAFLPGDYFIAGEIVYPTGQDPKDQQDIPVDMQGKYTIDTLAVLIQEDGAGTWQAYPMTHYRRIAGTYEAMYAEMMQDAVEREPEKYGLCWIFDHSGISSDAKEQADSAVDWNQKQVANYYDTSAWGGSVAENDTYFFYVTRNRVNRINKKTKKDQNIITFAGKDVECWLYLAQDTLYYSDGIDLYSVDCDGKNKQHILDCSKHKQLKKSRKYTELWGMQIYQGEIYLKLDCFEICRFRSQKENVKQIAFDARSCCFYQGALYYHMRSSEEMTRVDLKTGAKTVVRKQQTKDSPKYFGEIFTYEGTLYYALGGYIYAYTEDGKDHKVLSSGDCIMVSDAIYVVRSEETADEEYESYLYRYKPGEGESNPLKIPPQYNGFCFVFDGRLFYIDEDKFDATMVPSYQVVNLEFKG